MKLHVLLLVPMMVLTGCIFQGDKIPFDTVAKAESSYEGKEPLLFVATSYEDALDFVQYTGLKDELKGIDYHQYIVVCVLLGVKPEGYDIEIKELIRKEEGIVLLTTFREPEFGKPLPDKNVSPFHIIKIRISELGIKGEVSFLLEDTRGFLHAKAVVEL